VNRRRMRQERAGLLRLPPYSVKQPVTGALAEPDSPNRTPDVAKPRAKEPCSARPALSPRIAY